MATQSSEVTIQGLKKLHISEEKGENRVDARSEKLIFDLEGRDDDHVDPIEKITEGFLRFKTCEYDKHPEIFDQLANTQDPKFMVFACCDFRVSPSHVLRFRLGEAFMVRNIANIWFPNSIRYIANKYISSSAVQLRYSGVGAAIEYAFTVLKAENILIMGHSKCGGINRLMSLPDDSITYDFLDDWVKLALPAKAKVEAEHPDSSDEEKRQICGREAVKLSLVNIQTYPYVTRALADKKLKLWGGYYDFLNGKFELWGVGSEITSSSMMP